MLGPDTGRSRIRFTNANGGQQYIIQSYRARTYGPSTEISELPKTNSKLSKIVNLLGKEEKQKTNHIQILIFEDGRIEKRIVIE